MASNKDSDSHHCMVSVLGYTAHNKVFNSSTHGTGKSCLCCRFTHPAVDDYIDDHPSLLALHEFESSVVCTDSFLYWGSKQLEYPSKGKMPKVTVDVTEHTLFYHDETSKAFPKIANLHDIDKYTKQAIAVPNSSRKISYYARDCIGFPDRYSCLPYPNNVNRIPRGFVIVCDVSVKLPQFNAHLTATEQIAHRLYKDSKSPFIVAATKRDSADSESLQKLYEWAYKKKITVIETSAKENVNVKLVFSHITTKILKGAKLSSTLVSYSEAIGNSLMETTRSRQKFKQFLKHKVRSSNFMLSSIEASDEYIETVEILGKFGADEIYARHLLEIRDTEVKNYPGVLENPDMRMEMLEQFVDDISLELVAHKRTLKSMINTLVSPNDSQFYINGHSSSSGNLLEAPKSTSHHGPPPDIPTDELYEDIDCLADTASLISKSSNTTEDEVTSDNAHNSAKPSPSIVKRSSPELLRKPLIPVLAGSTSSSTSTSPALLKRNPGTATPTTSIANELQTKLKEGKTNLTRGPPPSYHSLQYPNPQTPRPNKVEINVSVNVSATQIVTTSPIPSPQLQPRVQDCEQTSQGGDNSADISDRYGILTPGPMSEADLNTKPRPKEKSALTKGAAPPPPIMPRPPRDAPITNVQQQESHVSKDLSQLPPLPEKQPPPPPYDPLVPKKLIKDESKPSETGTKPRPIGQGTPLPLPPESISHHSERPPLPLPHELISHQSERPPLPLPSELSSQLPVQPGPRESNKPDLPSKAPATKAKPPPPLNKPTNLINNSKPQGSIQAGSTPPVFKRNSIITSPPNSTSTDGVGVPGDDDIYVSSSADMDDIQKPIPPVPSALLESQASKKKKQSDDPVIYQNKGPVRNTSPPLHKPSPPPPLRNKPKKQISNDVMTSESTDQSTKPGPPIAPLTKPNREARSKKVVSTDLTKIPPILPPTKPRSETRLESSVLKDPTEGLSDPTKPPPVQLPTKPSSYSETTPISKTEAGTKKPEVAEYKPRLDALRRRVEEEKQLKDKQEKQLKDKQQSFPPPSYPAPSQPSLQTSNSPSMLRHNPRPSLPLPDGPPLPTTSPTKSLPHSRSMESDTTWAPTSSHTPSSHTPHSSKTLPRPSNSATPSQPNMPPPLPPRTPDMQDISPQFDYNGHTRTDNADQGFERQRARTTIGVPMLATPGPPSQPVPSPGSLSPQRRSTKRKDYFDMVKKRFFTKPKQEDNEEHQPPVSQPHEIPVRKPQFVNMTKRPLPQPPEEALDELFAGVPIETGIDYEPVDGWDSTHRPPPPLPTPDHVPSQRPQTSLPVPPELIPANTEELLQNPQKMEEFVRQLLLQMNANRQSTEPTGVNGAHQSPSQRRLPQRSRTFNHPHQVNQDDEGYEITDDWGVPPPLTEMEYHYPEIRGVGDRKVYPSRTSPQKHKPRAPTPPTYDDDYMNMTQEGNDEEFDYENAEAIRRLRTGRSLDDTSLPSRKLIPRRNSLDESTFYYNLYSRDLLSGKGGVVPPRGNDPRVDNETGQSQTEASDSVPAVKRKPRPLPPRNLPRGPATTSSDSA